MAERDFYAYWLKHWQRGVAVDVGKHVGYLFIYVFAHMKLWDENCRIFTDKILQQACTEELRKLLESYLFSVSRIGYDG